MTDRKDRTRNLAVAMQTSVAAITKREDTNPKVGVKEYGDVKFADEKNHKYPINTEKHVRAAWAYINMPKNAAKYSSQEVSEIKSKIKAAAKHFGIDTSPDGRGASEAKAAFECADDFSGTFK